jgi:hypothetical protein
MIATGGAGHVTPMFELAKAMKYHNVTFLTEQVAQSFVDFKTYTSSTFRVAYTNDSPDALAFEKTNREQRLTRMLNISTFNGVSIAIQNFGPTLRGLLNKTIHILTLEYFDVIISASEVFGVPALSEKVNVPCVTYSPTLYTSILDASVPSSFSMLTTEDFTRITHRMYNTVFTIRLMMKAIPQMIPALYAEFQSLPHISGPFQDIFTLRNLWFSKSKCLKLVSLPPSFFTTFYSQHDTKYLGVFMDENHIDNVDDDLAKWIKLKPIDSVLYGTFGSTSVIPHNRMYNLISGLAAFLLKVNSSYLLLAFQSQNFDTFQTILKESDNDEFLDIFNNHERVRVENGFVQQKWILQQNSVKVFLTHCGISSCLEGLYFNKPILCMPFNYDQFINAIKIENLRVGHSLFVPPSALQSLVNPYDFVQYTFTSSRVTSTISAIWTNEIYEKAARLISLEMKHAGGLKRAVEDIEFFVHLGGDLSRFAPFQSRLSFYQRYMLDLLLIFVILPGAILKYVILKCCKRQRKQKTD